MLCISFIQFKWKCFQIKCFYSGEMNETFLKKVHRSRNREWKWLIFTLDGKFILIMGERFKIFSNYRSFLLTTNTKKVYVISNEKSAKVIFNEWMQFTEKMSFSLTVRNTFPQVNCWNTADEFHQQKTRKAAFPRKKDFGLIRLHWLIDGSAIFLYGFSTK